MTWLVHLIDRETGEEGYLWRGKAVRIENAKVYLCPWRARRARGVFEARGTHKATVIHEKTRKPCTR